MAETKAFYFAAFKNDAAFECVDDMEPMPSLAIFRNMTGFLIRLGILLVLFLPHSGHQYKRGYNRQPDTMCFTKHSRPLGNYPAAYLFVDNQKLRMP